MRKRDRVLNGADATTAATPVVQGYIAQLQQCLRQLPVDQIAAIVDRLRHVVRSGGQILVAGNGGSAATASHMALDVGKSTAGRPPRPGAVRVRTIALNDAGPVVTAWANDHGYERVFAEQITALARPGDAVVFLSVSGNSPNVVEGARAARAAGAVVIALVGRPGGAARGLADLAVVVPSEDYQLVEDVHLAISHMVTLYLTLALASTAGSGHAERRGTRRAVAHAAAPLAVRKRQIGRGRARRA